MSFWNRNTYYVKQKVQRIRSDLQTISKKDLSSILQLVCFYQLFCVSNQL